MNVPGVPARRRLGALSLTALAAIAVACAGRWVHIPDPIDVRVVSPSADELRASFSDPPSHNTRRVARLSELFREAGCADVKTEHGGATQQKNVICTLPGQSPSTILVGSHVDRPSDGLGLVENWAAASLLPHLYRAVATEPRHHTFVFAGFANAILQQRGSRGYLRRLGSAGRSLIRAMVNLKALGVGSTAVWHTKSDPGLVEDLYSVAMAMDLPPLRFQRFYVTATADSRSFRYWGIPTITIHSLDQKTARVLSEPIRDGRTIRVNLERYRESARLVAVFLGYIDRTLKLRVERSG